MTTTDVTAPAAANVIPGASALGFGIDITVASDWTMQTARLVRLDTEDGRTVSEPPHGPNQTEYLVPANVSVIDKWNLSVAFEMFDSRQEYCSSMAASADVKASAWGFSSEFEASYSKIDEGEETSHYGVASANSLLWQVDVDDLSGLSLDPSFAAELKDLPEVFDKKSQDQFFAFFRKWGTHVIVSATAGGSLNYCVTVSGSSSMTKEDAKAKMQLEYDSVFVDASGSASADWSKMGSAWLSSRHATLAATGGSPDAFSDFRVPSDFNEPVNVNDVFTAWTNSIVGAPSVIGARLRPISSVAPVSHANVVGEALDAYLNARIGAQATFTWTPVPDGTKVTANASFVTVGTADVAPPTPQKDALEAGYWIVIANGEGDVVFNENVVGDDPAHFDTLTADAEKASAGKSYPVAVVASGTSGPLSAAAIRWLQSCGVQLPARWGAYAGVPEMFAATGRTNSSGYDGKMAAWYVDSPTLLPSVAVDVPLFACGQEGTS